MLVGSVLWRQKHDILGSLGLCCKCKNAVSAIHLSRRFSAAIPGSNLPPLLKESFCIHPVIFHVGSSINPLGGAPKPLDPVSGWSNGTWAWISTALLEIHPHK